MQAQRFLRLHRRGNHDHQSFQWTCTSSFGATVHPRHGSVYIHEKKSVSIFRLKTSRHGNFPCICNVCRPCSGFEWLKHAKGAGHKETVADFMCIKFKGKVCLDSGLGFGSDDLGASKARHSLDISESAEAAFEEDLLTLLFVNSKLRNNFGCCRIQAGDVSRVSHVNKGTSRQRGGSFLSDYPGRTGAVGM